MPKLFGLIPAVAWVLLLPPLQAIGQDSPSLGDAARQARLQKQQKEAQAKEATDKVGQDPENKDSSNKTQRPPASPKRVTKIITNEEIPEHNGPAMRPMAARDGYREGNGAQPSSAATEGKAEGLKSQIVSMKSYIASLQAQIESLNGSIHFAPANCVANCVQWNERQLLKQQQLEQMKAQLEEQQKQLEDLQESARQQGFGSSVYDP